MTKHNHVKIMYTLFCYFLSNIYVTVNITSKTDYLSSQASMNKGSGVYNY